MLPLGAIYHITKQSGRIREMAAGKEKHNVHYIRDNVTSNKTVYQLFMELQKRM